MTADLAAFLRERLDEDEAAAKACTAEGAWDGDWEERELAAAAPHLAPEVRAHIARHDPARVLAEVDAKRRIIGWASTGALPDYEVRYVLDALALPFAGHPDYREG